MRGASSLEIRLLTDLKVVFDEAESLFTNTLLERLHPLDESPWGDLKGKPLSARTLSNLLSQYGIEPTTVRERGKDKPLKGYRRADFHDAWTRYVGGSHKKGLHPLHPTQTGIANAAKVRAAIGASHEYGAGGNARHSQSSAHLAETFRHRQAVCRRLLPRQAGRIIVFAVFHRVCMMQQTAVRNAIRKREPFMALSAPSLTPRRERFAQGYITLGNATEAFRRAFKATSMKPATAKRRAFWLLREPGIAARIAELRFAAAQSVVIDVRERMSDLLAICTADATEISRVVIGACRHCHGRGGLYQWIDEHELQDAIESAQARIEAGAKRVRMPNGRGGFGFNASLAPREDCRKCAGDGLSRVVITPTEQWSPAARRLFKAARQRADGSIEIELESRQAASEQLAKLAGWNVDRSISLSVSASIPPLRDLSADEAMEFLERQRAIA